MRTRVKICGLTRAEDIAVACKAGAAYVGFNFFAKSPRYLTPDAAQALAIDVPVGVAKVALVVDATDEALDAIDARVPLDMIQLHGSETPARVSEIRARYGLPIMKVIGVATGGDMASIAAYEAVADQILLDAKPPPGADLPGGNGLTFDWRLLEGYRWKKPWMLAGGLTPENAGEAVLRTGARQIDVASGVESAPGVKDAGKLSAFLSAVP